jgi:hypothetical protein
MEPEVQEAGPEYTVILNPGKDYIIKNGDQGALICQDEAKIIRLESTPVQLNKGLSFYFHLLTHRFCRTCSCR